MIDTHPHSLLIGKQLDKPQPNRFYRQESTDPSCSLLVYCLAWCHCIVVHSYAWRVSHWSWWSFESQRIHSSESGAKCSTFYSQNSSKIVARVRGQSEFQKTIVLARLKYWTGRLSNMTTISAISINVFSKICCYCRCQLVLRVYRVGQRHVSADDLWLLSPSQRRLYLSEVW